MPANHVRELVDGEGNKYELSFCGEPTSDGDARALVIRQYYEKHRETWWERRSRIGRMTREGIVADNFILGLMMFVEQVDEAYAAFKQAHDVEQKGI